MSNVLNLDEFRRSEAKAQEDLELEAEALIVAKILGAEPSEIKWWMCPFMHPFEFQCRFHAALYYDALLSAIDGRSMLPHDIFDRVRGVDDDELFDVKYIEHMMGNPFSASEETVRAAVVMLRLALNLKIAKESGR